MHLVLTVPNRSCGPAQLARWLHHLQDARRMLLTRGKGRRQRSRFGTDHTPVPNWRLWKLEITYNPERSWWHPHYHVLIDGWLPVPVPPGLARIRTTRTRRARAADFFRLRWAHCLRVNHLPAPPYDVDWIPGDQAATTLVNLVELNPFDDDMPAGDELTKYVTKPELLHQMPEPRRAELFAAIGVGRRGKFRTWQPAKGFLPAKSKDREFTYIGSLNRLLHHPRDNKGDLYPAFFLAEAIAHDLAAIAAGKPDPNTREGVY